MYQRSLKPLLSNSFFLFGARGTGKTSLLLQLLPPSPEVLWLDLLDDSLYQRLLVRPELFKEMIPAHFGAESWVVADEIQRLPSLLNYVHQLIEARKIRFALTGSSARKLKRGGANLLAGRAFLNSLYPLSYRELGADFQLDFALHWGSLPKTVSLRNDLTAAKEYLRAYASIYLKEEIKEEQVVRRIAPFARFLEVAAQHNGKILNFAAIARDSLSDAKSIQRYFDVLVDTLLGFYLEPYHRSVRKVQTSKAKFFFFDPGVKKALDGTLSHGLAPSTSAFGEAFEHLFLLECLKLRDYARSDDCFYYLRTKDDVEIDLLIERPGRELWAIEIKSADRVDLAKFERKKSLVKDVGAKRFIVASREKIPRVVDGVEILPWQMALDELYPTP